MPASQRAEPRDMALEPGSLGGGDELLEHELERDLSRRGGPALDQPPEGASQRAGDQPPRRRRLVPQVGRVAAEQLVGTLSREHDLHVGAGRVGEQIGGEDGGIAQRLGE